MDSDSYHSMLASLRQQFTQRLPNGLTPPADQRLQRTLEHYTKEILRVHGSVQEQEILRETFDSMAKWFRRNTTQLTPDLRKPPMSPIQPMTDGSVLPGAGSQGSTPLSSIFGESTMSSVSVPSEFTSFSTSHANESEDPMILLERLRNARSAPLDMNATGVLPAPIATSVANIQPSPLRIPELESIETRIQTKTGGQQPKDFLQRQEDVVKYRETEYNLVVNSKDRNWLQNTKENRYSFTVQVNGGSVPQGKGYQATLQQRLKNITRIEFVKAILPVEGLDVVVSRNGSNPTPDQTFYSALALPFVHVMMDEINGNNVGTTDLIDKSLAICQYDATWRSDNVSVETTMNRGYTLFFPKFMKAQRVYAPVPLANLQKMSFQLLDPENQPLSKLPDSVTVKRVIFGKTITGVSTNYNTTLAAAGDGNSEYLYIETNEWFPLWSFSQLDRVLLDGMTFTSVTPATQIAGETMNAWLQREEGHIVVGIGYNSTGSPDAVTDGANDAGYANMIILRNRMLDPITNGGVVARDYFAPDVTQENTLASEVATYDTTGYQKGGVLNLSRQVQLVLRVITRDFDSASNIRPDNV